MRWELEGQNENQIWVLANQISFFEKYQKRDLKLNWQPHAQMYAWILGSNRLIMLFYIYNEFIIVAEEKAVSSSYVHFRRWGLLYSRDYPTAQKNIHKNHLKESNFTTFTFNNAREFSRIALAVQN